MLPLKGDTQYWITKGLTQAYHANPGSGYPTADGSHNGVDFGCAPGTSILAAWAGQVVKADYDAGYGRHVRILHDNGNLSIYGHLTKIEVRVGERVTEGEYLGTSGGGLDDAQRGQSTGPHLHFEVRVNPYDARTCTDPLGWVEGLFTTPHPTPWEGEGALRGWARVTAAPWVRVRKAPSLQAAIMGQVLTGEAFQVAPIPSVVVDGMEWVPLIYWTARGWGGESYLEKM